MGVDPFVIEARRRLEAARVARGVPAHGNPPGSRRLPAIELQGVFCALLVALQGVEGRLGASGGVCVGPFGPVGARVYLGRGVWKSGRLGSGRVCMGRLKSGTK